MEGTCPIAKLAAEQLSPSKITDYFGSSPGPLPASKENKGVGEKSPSVYLTPESSPYKEDGDDLIPLQEIEDNLVARTKQSSTMSGNRSEAGKSVSLSDKETCKEECTPEKVKKTDVEYDATLSKRSLDFSPTDGSVSLPKPSKPGMTLRRSIPHRICHGKSVIVEKSSTNVVVSTESEVDSVKNEAAATAQSKVSTLPKTAKQTAKGERATSTKGVAQSGVTLQTVSSKAKSGRKKKTEPVQSSTITDFFPVRRSGRQTRTQIEKETEHHFAELVKLKCEEGLKVTEFEGKGRGVVATKIFDKGDFVVEYAGNLLDMETARQKESEYAECPDIGCYMYFFYHHGRQYCIDATDESGRLGRLINHSRDGNCRTRVVMLDGKPRLILVAAKHINTSEELCYDYGDRSKTALEAHPWLKL